MKKLLTLVLVIGGIAPALAFAAFNDVTLTSSASISLNSGTLDVVGDANVIETMTITATELIFTLDNGSKLKVSSPTFKQIQYDGSRTYVSSSICESNESSINFTSSTDDVTLTVGGVKSAACPEGRAASTGSSSGDGATTVVAVTTLASRAALIANLQTQLQSLLAQLATMQGVATSATVTSSSGKASITTNLTSGSRGASVKTLQQFLNTHGFIVASSGPGSPGKETDRLGPLTVKAVQKFQEKYNIAKPGEPGYGRVGPKTRAKINEFSAQ